MSKLIVHNLDAIREFIDAADYTAALSLLDEVDVASFDEHSVAEYYRVLSFVLFSTGEYGRALEASSECLVQTPAGNLYECAIQKNLHGRILHQLGRLTEAVETLVESHSTLQLLGAATEALGPLHSLAALHFLNGDYSASVRTLEQAIDICTSQNVSNQLPPLRSNFARVLVRVGDMLRAGPALRAVLRAEIDDRLRHCATYLLGMVATFKRLPVRACALLNTSLDYYERTGSGREVVICHEYLGLNEHFAGNQEKAKEYFQGILARDQITASARAQTLRMLTDVYVAEGNYSEALTTADQAEVAITKINERIEVGCLHRSRTRIAAATGNEPEARRQFAASVEMLQMIGAQYELAETYLLGGQLDLFEIKSRHEFLKQAVLLFVKCGVTARANVAALQLSRLLPPVPDRGEEFSSPLASAYVACQLLKTD